MGNVLIVVETHAGALRTASLPAVTFGKQLAEKTGGSVSLLVIGKDVGKAAEEAAKFGAAEVLVADDAKLEHYLAETYAPIIAKVAKDKGATVVAGTATAVGKDVLPRVSALLDAGMVADVIGIAGPKTFKRPMMAGNVILQLEVTTPIVVASIRQTEFPPAQPAGAGAVSKVDAGNIDTGRAAFVSLSEAKSERPELTEAKVVVS